MIRFVVAVFLAGIIGDFIHIHVGIGGQVYSPFIMLMSYATKPLEALGFGLIYYLLGDRLPTQSRILKGLMLGILILLSKGELIRQPFMNLLLPNTVAEVFLRQSQVWLSNLVMAIIIALLIKPKYSSDVAQ